MNTRLRHVAQVNPQTPEFDDLGDEVEIPFLPLEAIWPGHRFDPSRMRPKRELLSGYTRFLEGDILVPKITPTFQADRTVIATGITGGVAAATTEVHVVRVGPCAETRFIRYLLSSKSFLNEGEAAMFGVAGQKRVPDELIRDLVIPVLEIKAQQIIADYLDAVTARLDALVDKKRRMMALIDSRRAALIEQAIRGLVESYGSIPLKHAVRRVEVGIVVTPAAWYSDEGILALRGLNIRPGGIVLDDVVKISEEGHHLHQKSKLYADDVVVVRTGQTGTAAVIPESLDGCNCIDLVIVRPSVALLPKFIEFVLNSDWTQKHVEAYSVGTIQSHFNVGAMKEVPFPAAPIENQRAVVNDLTLATAALDQLQQKLVRQVDLLVEHRQALITAAVTGQLEVPGVAA